MWSTATPNYVQKDEDIYWIEHLNEKQLKSYEEFVQKLKEENLLYPGQDGEITLKQFLQARQYNIDKATTMYKTYIEWFKEEGIENFTSSYEYPEKQKVLKLYPQFYFNHDKFYRPVYIQILGQLNTVELLKETTLDRYIKYHIKTWEQMKKYILPELKEKAGRPIFSCTTILDLKGLGIANFTSTTKSFLTRTSKIDSDNYPEQLGQMFVINAPYIFTIIWTFIKPLLDVRTQGKIIVLGSNYQEALLQVIPKENLPEFLGGTHPCDLENVHDYGPWDTTYTSKEPPKTEAERKAESDMINSKSIDGQDEPKGPPPYEQQEPLDVGKSESPKKIDSKIDAPTQKVN